MNAAPAGERQRSTGLAAGPVEDTLVRQMTKTEPRYVRYSAEVERAQPDEERIVDEILASMMRQLDRTSDQRRHAVRGTHSKSHAFLEGRLEVLPDLPEELRQGLFATVETYPVIVRLASILGEVAADSVRTQRGFAWKVIGVEGQMLPSHGGEVTQDFLMDDGRTFPVADVRAFLDFQKAQEATVGKVQHGKAALSAVQSVLSGALKSVGVENAKIDFLGHPPHHILAAEFTTQAAVRYGDYVAKIMVRPASANVLALKDVVHDVDRGFSVLREDVAEFFATQGAEYEVCVQLCTDLAKMPVEDLTVEWPEADSPFRPVAKIVIAPQETYSPARRVYGDDVLSFSPAHSLEAHRPLGSIMRARLKVYPRASEFRHRFNAKERVEPRSIEELPA